jgi:hypothetical protein
MNSTMPRLPALNVERAVEVEHPRVALGVAVELGDVLRADQHRGVLVVWVDRRHHGDATAFLFREMHRDDRQVLVAAAEVVLQPEAADRAQVALDAHVQHLLELAPELPRDQVQRLLLHRAALDAVDRFRLLEAAAQFLDQRALAGPDRTHEVQNLPALLGLQRGGMEVSHELRDDPLDAEELVLEEAVNLQGLVAEQASDPRVVGARDLLAAVAHHNVVETGVREARDFRGFLEPFQILDERSAPLQVLPGGAIPFDHSGKLIRSLFHAD